MTACGKLRRGPPTTSSPGSPSPAAILRMIYADEIGHVRVGADWFNRVAGARGLEPEQAFRTLVATRFKGELKPPFNGEARSAAGLPPGFYAPAGARGGTP